MKILLISNNYPSSCFPSMGVFVYHFAQQLSKLGHEVTVISPRKISLKNGLREKVDYGAERCKVYRPRYLSFSTRILRYIKTYQLTVKSNVRVIRRTIRRQKIEFEIVYAHFISTALIAVQALEGGGKPIVVGVGENRNIDVCRSLYRLSKYNGLLSKITRFIAVSEIIKTKLTSLGISESKILLAPNGVDLAFFNSRGKHFCRSKYGIGEDDKVIAFVGRFTHDKGALRLVQAVDGIDNVKVMFIGSGPQELKSSAIVFKGSVPYTILPELLSCADIFALPTLHEGASNALIEAMAMGLPIISSDIPEIRLQCDPSCSILVDPMNIEELKAAIRSLVDNESMLRFMGDNARLKSLEFDLFQRASLIVKMFHQLF